ncbi:hypothetical protein CIP107566_02037 [Corynebacterium diphtheriae]|nr:hypothetical protein CIP107566_02037 [Corynebacterium diphtheriae]
MEKRGAGVVAAVSNFCTLTTFPRGGVLRKCGLRVQKLLTPGCEVVRGAGFVGARRGVSGRGEQFLRLNDVSRRGVLRKCRLRVQILLTTGC